MRRPESPFRRRSSVALRGLLIVAVPLSLQVALLLALAGTQLVQESDRRERQRSRELHESAQKLLLLLVDAETGVRGYALTGEPAFAEPYHRARAAIPHELATIRRLAVAERRSSVAGVSASADDALTFLRESIGGSSAPSSETALLRAQIGKQRMDRFRAQIGRFIASLDAQERRRENAARTASARLMTLLWITIVADVAVAFVTIRLFTSQITRRLATVIENEHRLVDGEELHAPLTGNDEIAEVDYYFHHMAAQLRESTERMSEAMKELEAFSYSVSHDLRAPLRAVSGYAQILDEDYSGALDDDGRRYVAAVRSESKRMGTLIDDLLTFSRLGRAALAAGELDMTTLVAEVHRSVVAQTPDREVLLNCGELPVAIADRSMIRQVLVNLFTNAVKFSAPREAAVIDVGASAGGEECTYWVRDQGVGFDMRYADKLFRTFERLHTAEQFEGTGVGLAIVERIIRRHGGRVWAHGVVNRGATFYFTLPVAAAVRGAA